jgi:inner membrane protein
MASLITHGCVALLVGKGAALPLKTRRFWVLSVVAACLPDIDVIGFRFGITYGSFFGHRGFTHSLFFAGVLALAIVLLGFRQLKPGSRPWGLLVLFYFGVAASHGVLDALTDGGLGVAFFSPFENSRYFFPFRPIPVSPLGIAAFISPFGLLILMVEFLVIVLPLFFVVRVIELARRRWISTWIERASLVLLFVVWLPLVAAVHSVVAKASGSGPP